MGAGTPQALHVLAPKTFDFSDSLLGCAAEPEDAGRVRSAQFVKSSEARHQFHDFKIAW
jgi:hypothetical protein